MTEASKVKEESGENCKVGAEKRLRELEHVRERAAAMLEFEGKLGKKQ